MTAAQGETAAQGVLNAYLAPIEVAALLRVSVKSLYRWTRDPRTKLPVVRIGGTLRFSRVSLERWLQAEEQRPSPRLGRALSGQVIDSQMLTSSASMTTR